MFSRVSVCSKEGYLWSHVFSGWVGILGTRSLTGGSMPGGGGWYIPGGEYGEQEKGIVFFDLCCCSM